MSVNEKNKIDAPHQFPPALASGLGLKCFGNKTPCKSSAFELACNKNNEEEIKDMQRKINRCKFNQ
jgi:hypothetical protein